jgi:enoyl-CoA hydratase/carnithine racemase
VLRGGTFFLGNHPLKVVVITVRTTTFSAGFGIKGIMKAWVRQDGFAKFITIKRQ